MIFIATKLSLMVDNHKPKCPLKILDCCVQGQGYSEHSKFLYFYFCSAPVINAIDKGSAQVDPIHGWKLCKEGDVKSIKQMW